MLKMILPYLLGVFAIVLAIIMDRLANLQRADRDRGDYWGRIMVWFFFPMTVLLLLSQLLPKIPGWPSWLSLYLEQQNGAGDVEYYCALLFPFLAWGLVLLISLLVGVDPGNKARWITGGVGEHNSRYWLLWCAALPLILVAIKIGDLGAGIYYYPAALWGTLTVAIITLLGISLSAGKSRLFLPEDDETIATDTATSLALKAWPELMKASDIKVNTLLTWPKSESKRELQTPQALFIDDTLHKQGAKGVAPELIEAASALFSAEQAASLLDTLHLVLAPECCGQIEVIALMAQLLDQQTPTGTLLITADGAEELAGLICRCLPEASSRIAVLGYGEVNEDALIWLVDAYVLSDRLLMQLKNSERLTRRIGLVVWWELQNYSGVTAANLWAISRRLHRLLRARGRHNLRNFATLSTATEDAQQSDFVRRLLPYPTIIKTYIPMNMPQTISLHLLGSLKFTPNRQYLLLQAATATIKGNWPTYIKRPDFVSVAEWAEFSQQTIASKQVSEQLCASLSEAAVDLITVQSSDVLDLPGKVVQIGRSSLEMPLRHVAIMQPMNPYLGYLLGVLARDKKFTTSRRLICAQSCPAIIHRHLLMGLNELPDTHRGLMNNAMWDRHVVNKTLKKLASEGSLNKREVRFLDAKGRLSVDYEYQSKFTPSDHHRPLDSVAQQLIEVRERAGDSEGDGVRLRFDPERLLIKAYPGRIFMYKGQRYRVREWTENALDQYHDLECEREDRSYQTWRIHTSTIFSFKSLADKTTEVAIGRQGRLERLAVRLKYQEEITGRIEWAIDAYKNPTAEPQRTYFPPISRTFKTCALILRFVNRPNDPNALPSLCQALRYTLPVHLGVEEDALEVVCLRGDEIYDRPTFGVAIVDLYPDGIGLIDSIYDDNSLLLDLLQWTRDWLTTCPDDGLQTPVSLATNIDLAPHPQPALELLNQIV